MLAHAVDDRDGGLVCERVRADLHWHGPAHEQSPFFLPGARTDLYTASILWYL
jgi:hypothetical protein